MIPQAHASYRKAETFYGQCSGRIFKNEIFVRPGDTLILDYTSPAAVSLYPTDNCTLFSNESSVAYTILIHDRDNGMYIPPENFTNATNITLLGQRAIYDFQMQDVNMTFMFICHDENLQLGCESGVQKNITIHVQPGPAIPDNEPAPKRPKIIKKIRTRSKELKNQYHGKIDDGLIFLALVGSLGVIALVMNLSIELKDKLLADEAQRIACEMNAENQ